jgi:hypothetical protein
VYAVVWGIHASELALELPGQGSFQDGDLRVLLDLSFQGKSLELSVESGKLLVLLFQAK